MNKIKLVLLLPFIVCINTISASERQNIKSEKEYRQLLDHQKTPSLSTTFQSQKIKANRPKSR